MRKMMTFLGLPAKTRAEPASALRGECRICKIHAGFDSEDPNICIGDSQMVSGPGRRAFVGALSCAAPAIRHVQQFVPRSAKRTFLDMMSNHDAAHTSLSIREHATL
eukprot:Tamp_11362.p4 GENE.Tamp_11362~~Tamp_11362.p4  ORF type:complete len:107 (+),score=8.70 Tamp_11362:297-617(+)